MNIPGHHALSPDKGDEEEDEGKNSFIFSIPSSTSLLPDQNKDTAKSNEINMH